MVFDGWAFVLSIPWSLVTSETPSPVIDISNAKSGSIAWQPGYNEATNQYTLAGTSYDANGNLLNDSFHTYSGDSEGNTLGIGAINLTYDALDRVVEQNPSSGTYYQIVYTPMGTKLGVYKASTGGPPLRFL